jgi:DNA-binding beta-propeller fold protein YncE
MALTAAWQLMALDGCHHNPYTPNIGSAYITSWPSQAEILIDGASARRSTPAKVDNLSAGDHEISLRYFGWKVWKGTATIRPGQMARVSARLQPINPSLSGSQDVDSGGADMAYEPSLSRLYIANSYGASMTVVELEPGTGKVQGVHSVGIGRAQQLVAACYPARRIYLNTGGDTLAAFDILSYARTGTIVPPRPMAYSRLSFAPSGSLLVAADTLGNSLAIIDPGRDSIIRIVPLPGKPGDVDIDPFAMQAIVAFTDLQRVSLVDLGTGRELRAAATGTWPGCIFRNRDGRNAGWCNRADLSLQTIDLAGWTVNRGARIPYGDFLTGACFASDYTHIWTITTRNGTASHRGALYLVYWPNWEVVSVWALDELPWRLAQSADGRCLYIYHRGDGQLHTWITDTE